MLIAMTAGVAVGLSQRPSASDESWYWSSWSPSFRRHGSQERGENCIAKDTTSWPRIQIADCFFRITIVLAKEYATYVVSLNKTCERRSGVAVASTCERQTSRFLLSLDVAVPTSPAPFRVPFLVQAKSQSASPAMARGDPPSDVWLSELVPGRNDAMHVHVLRMKQARRGYPSALSFNRTNSGRRIVCSTWNAVVGIPEVSGCNPDISPQHLSTFCPTSRETCEQRGRTLGKPEVEKGWDTCSLTKSSVV
ncbi:uncharacterized protein BDZ99DRAFT_63453 [Mytilinidion resinicola]|uniref:Uncharacterized protein n=1 Tax=Mytilinidion resinicola TaxID=574789 RepID=A0A6A6YFW9_9PEZI|nr:uncharacterized protein BDZ99DRAFT_63453 [Mytilinidion resinicola]KAF2807716.1 hypothetical protein BDZ99DRAFT_63453 [Mytilinidion resinicola]